MSDKTTRKTPSKLNLKSKRAIIWAVIVIASMALLFGVYEVGRYDNKWGEPDTLRMIKKEKMASDDLLGLELISYRQDGEGSLIGKTVRPSVVREFQVNASDKDATVQKIVETAEADGWVYDPSIYTGATDRRIWRKTSGDGDVRLVLYIEEREDSIEVDISGYDY